MCFFHVHPVSLFSCILYSRRGSAPLLLLFTLIYLSSSFSFSSPTSIHLLCLWSPSSFISTFPHVSLLQITELHSLSSPSTLPLILVSLLSPAAQQPYTMCFRMKFYPHEPMKIKEELTRYRLTKINDGLWRDAKEQDISLSPCSYACAVNLRVAHEVKNDIWNSGNLSCCGSLCSFGEINQINQSI